MTEHGYFQASKPASGPRPSDLLPVGSSQGSFFPAAVLPAAPRGMVAEAVPCQQHQGSTQAWRPREEEVEKQPPGLLPRLRT